MTTQNEESLQIINNGYEILINIHRDPFYLSAIEKRGAWRDEKYRGLILEGAKATNRQRCWEIREKLTKFLSNFGINIDFFAT